MHAPKHSEGSSESLLHHKGSPDGHEHAPLIGTGALNGERADSANKKPTDRIAPANGLRSLDAEQGAREERGENRIRPLKPM
jgi:hypothetical protein